jgi:cell division protein FtsB
MNLGSIFQSIFQSGARRVGYLFVIALITGYGWIALHGPQQEQNAALALENQRRRERIGRLKDSPSEQEMEIRKQLKLVRPGETTFILPDAPKDAPKADEPGK